MEFNLKTISLAVTAAVVAIVGVGSLFSAFETVQTGNRGIKVTFGEVNEAAGSLPEGLYFMNPFTTDIKQMNVKVQTWDGTANTYTKDVQQANIKYVINFRLKPDQAHTTFRTVGTSWENALVIPVVNGILKQVVGTYDAVDLVAKRAEATARIQQQLQEQLVTRNVVLDRIELVNIQYLKEFEKAVEDKVVAVQRATEEQNRTVQIQEQAKQRVIEAEAIATSMRIRAKALESNPKLVEYEAVQKWDGKLPQYSLGTATPFINLTPAK
jgi:regulator of protease activity HflC (stomatin/prohibitin superfamily)